MQIAFLGTSSNGYVCLSVRCFGRPYHAIGLANELSHCFEFETVLLYELVHPEPFRITYQSPVCILVQLENQCC